MSELKFTVLVENSAIEGYEAEHGLSLWLEYRGSCWLIDAGQSDTFARNAEKAGIDLKRAEGAMLSHGHYDHSGGMETFLKINPSAPLYLRSECRNKTYHIDPVQTRYIGLSEGLLEQTERMDFVEGVVEIAPGLWLLPHITKGLEERGRKTCLYCEENGITSPDDFRHEQTLAIQTETGLVLVNSCSHGGIDTVIEEISQLLPWKIRAVIGGFHLGRVKLSYPPEEIHRLGRRLVELGVEEVYTGHCTGEEGYGLLKEELGERLHHLASGLTIEF